MEKREKEQKDALDAINKQLAAKSQELTDTDAAVAATRKELDSLAERVKTEQASLDEILKDKEGEKEADTGQLTGHYEEKIRTLEE